MGAQPSPERQAVSRQGTLPNFQNKEETTASSEFCFSALLEMGGMVL